MVFKEKQTNYLEMKTFIDNIDLIYRKLYLYIFNMVRNKELAEDILQNTFLTAYTKYSTLNDKNKFKSWIFTIAKRETAVVVKKYRREMQIDEETLEFLNKEQSYLLIEDTILKNELNEFVVQAINQLSPKLKNVIILYYYNNLSFKEIEKILNVKVDALKKRHMRAKSEINIYLDKNYFNKNNFGVS